MLSSVLGLLLIGCTTTESVVFNHGHSEQVVSHYSDINWVSVEPTKKINFTISSQNQQFLMPNGQSAIAAFNIGTEGKELALRITSHFKKTVFYPNAYLLNEQNQVIKVFTNDDFEYKHAYGLDGDRLEINVKIQPTDKQRVKLLIFTTPELVAGKSEVIHPIKLDAMARGNYPPDVPNPMIPHSSYGELSLYIKVDDAVILDTPVELSSTDVVQQEFQKDLKAQDLTKMGAATETMTISGTQTQLDEKQTQYYLNSIKSAVDAGLLDKALTLLDEAKELGIEDAQKVFVNAVNAKQ
ncbi:MalM family protein [Vibrio sp. 10N.286.49.B3]|uniref:MalM family protein n=1 Tax=Vibrio sp. 10N.286.49.B3 TaxID=1880855 RepID=UPI001F5367AF|nr:MalM family protein [Vibrio sp. 10N.286.49.B3]